MAGDWIKMEKATVRKPEVRTIARLLGISRREAIGLLFEFWCWLDDCVVDGHVDACVDADVDAEFCAGFAAALKVVGWAAFVPSPDGLTGRMTIPNAGRYFGETSKKRALTNERQARWRAKHVDARVDGHVDATPSTREEKKRITTERESITAPTDEHRIIAAKLKLDCEVEWLKYRDQQANAPRKHSDLQAGFRNWLRRAKEFQPQSRPGPAKQEARARVADDIWKGVDDGRSNERVIDGQVERVA